MRIKKIIPLTLVVLSVLLTVPVSADPPKVLMLALGGESTTGYDPLLGWGRYGNTLFYSTLLKRDESLKMVNDLAVSYSVSADRLVWKVKIREGVKFSDGTALTARDVAYTYHEAKISGGKVDMTVLDAAVAKGARDVEFKLKQPSVLFLNKMCTLGIVPAQKHKADANFSRHPVGSGPYRLVEWNEGQQLIVEENPHYYGVKPAIKKVVFLFMEEDASFAAARAGKVQAVSVPQLLAKQTIPGMTLHPVKSVDNRGICLPVVPDTGKKTPEGHPIGNNVTCRIEIRKALNIAVNRKLLVDGVLEGFGEPAYGIADNLPWDEPAIRFKDNDPPGAKKLLAGAGWKDADRDGILELNGLKAEFTLIYPAGDSIRQNLALAVADMALKIGIKIDVQGKSWDDIAKLNHANAILFGWGSHTPEEMYSVYYGKFAGNGNYNAGFYANPKVDAYFEKALAAPTFDASLKYWKLAQWDGKTGLSAQGDAPWVWLVNLTHTYFVSGTLDVGISALEPHGHGWPLTANIEKWKLK